jgi:hypothetical protein
MHGKHQQCHPQKQATDQYLPGLQVKHMSQKWQLPVWPSLRHHGVRTFADEWYTSQRTKFKDCKSRSHEYGTVCTSPSTDVSVTIPRGTNPITNGSLSTTRKRLDMKSTPCKYKRFQDQTTDLESEQGSWNSVPKNKDCHTVGTIAPTHQIMTSGIYKERRNQKRIILLKRNNSQNNNSSSAERQP